jgi:hypothetical protein
VLRHTTEQEKKPGGVITGSRFDLICEVYCLKETFFHSIRRENGRTESANPNRFCIPPLSNLTHSHIPGKELHAQQRMSPEFRGSPPASPPN